MPMQPNPEWCASWSLGVEPENEQEISEELLRLFLEFWESAGISKMSGKSQNKYAAGLWDLGGYLVGRCIDEGWSGQLAGELDEVLIGDEGPLIFHDDPQARNEFDSVCKQFSKWRRKSCESGHRD